MNKPVIKKIFYNIDMTLVSPMSIGNGVSDNSDQDVLLDKDNKPFIPGTSIAGVFSDYLDDKSLQNGDNQSPVTFNDAYCTSDEFPIYIRDGIRLDRDKQTIDKAKFDYEVVDVNAKFNFIIEITIRDENERYEKLIEDCLCALHKQEIAFGAKTTRGLGRVKLDHVGKASFDKDNLDDYLKFEDDKKDGYQDYTNQIIQKNVDSKYVSVEVSLTQLGGLSIRQYNANADEADFRHISNTHNDPIIPGSSWNGLIRSQFVNYFEMFNFDLNEIDDLFGKVEGKEAIKSSIQILESKITDNKNKIMTRTSIDRFTGGAINGSLYTEKVCVNGNTTLNIKISKDKNKDKYLAILLLILKDIDNGFVSLGGQSSIGRGLFKVNNIQIDGTEVKEDMQNRTISILKGAN